MSSIVLSPADRHSIVGKTGSGKSQFAIVLACTLVPLHLKGWEIWWVDSKHDPRDIAQLKRWGFGSKGPRKIVKIDPKNGPIPWQVLFICERALKRGKVLIVIDEYKHVVASTRRSSPVSGMGLERVHLQGRGLNVGLIGLTQEPVEIPRQLLSQATHLYLFDVSYPNDIKYVKTLYPYYQRPDRNVRHGFWYSHIDGDADWYFFDHQKEWYDIVTNGINTNTSNSQRQERTVV